IFLGDDGFGVEVARRLSGLDLPEWVRVGDYGTSGMHLAYDLAEGTDLAILVDAAPRGGEPGTVYVIEPDQRPGAATSDGGARQPPGGATSGERTVRRRAGVTVYDGHGMQPDVVLDVLDVLGAEVGRTLIVGCEPACVDYGIGLSAPVAGAVDD